MKKYLLLVLLSFTLLSFSQQYKAIPIIKQRSYYLNGGARAGLGGKSRETIKIDLPENTKACYYSFTTKGGTDGTEVLNLGVQLGAYMFGGFVAQNVASKIKVPEGGSVIDIYPMPISSRENFLKKDDQNFTFYKDISIQNAKDAVQYIDNSMYGNSFYIGLKNPSAMKGITVSIEVVAIVDDTKIDTNKGILYGNTGWQWYLKKDYKKSLYYSNKALGYDPDLSFVQFNIALVYLVKGKDEATEKYIDAIASCQKDNDPQESLKGALKDINDLKLTNPKLKNLDNIEQLLLNEIDTK